MNDVVYCIYSKQIFNYTLLTHFAPRLIKYDLDSEEDSVANYMILSLQVDQMLPALQVKTEYKRF